MENEIIKYSGIEDVFGNPIVTHDYAEKIRDEDEGKKGTNRIIAQRGGQEHILASKADVSIVGGSRGGPCSTNTLVLVEHGKYKKIIDLKPGDSILKPDGTIQHVVFNKYHGLLPCFEFIFTNGSKIISSADHTWSVSIDNGPFEDKNTLQIVEILSDHNNQKSVKVPSSIIAADQYITDYEYVGTKECCCIHVDDDDMLFVIEGGIVTHNSKSFSILLDFLKDITNPHFSGVLLRRELKDFDNLERDSRLLYKDYGQYLSSERSMMWNFNAGGTLKFNFHTGDYDDFVKRFQGKQYCAIACDEITHLEDVRKFFYLLTSLRNAHGIRNRFIGSCNPDRNSWVRQFIDWWIGNENTIYADGKKHPELAGYPIPERDGKLRYCCTAGCEAIADIIWGDSREEVWKKAKPRIDELGLYTEDMKRYGNPEDLFVLSVSFVESKLTDNKKLLEGDPAYIARLANQSRSQILADLRGNWDAQAIEESLVTEEDMNRFFSNSPQYGDGILRIADDVALEGGDNNWMWLIKGNHIVDVDVCALNAQDLVNHIDEKRREWGVSEENMVFDSNGIGGLLKGFFKRAVPFNNLESPYGSTKSEQDQAKRDYDTLKSQCMLDLAKAIKYGEVSIAPHLLDRRFSGKGFENTTLREILVQERKILAIDQKKKDLGKGQCIIPKAEMKKIIGRSPDAMESLGYWRVFFVKKKKPASLRPSCAASFSGRGGAHGRVLNPNRKSLGIRYK